MPEVQSGMLSVVKLMPFAAHLSRLARALLLLSVLVPCGQVFAKDYLIEVIVVENTRRSELLTGSSLYLPRIRKSLSLASDKAAELGFELVESPLAMTDYVEKLKGDNGFRVLRHFAWRQPGLAKDQAQAVRINLGRALDVYIPEAYREFDTFIPASTSPQFDGGSRAVKTTTINGSLRVWLSRFLHVDARLVYTNRDRTRSYRLEQSRKMRSRELHYLDNPKFGLLMRIVPIEPEPEPEPEPEVEPATSPETPATTESSEPAAAEQQ